MKSIGERIREERQNIGYTLEKLANEIGVTPSTILKYENGSINIPSDKIEKLSIALKTTPAYLMGWEDKSEEVKTAARDEKFFDKYSKLDSKKKKLVDDLINTLFDTMPDIDEDDDILK